MSAFMVSKAHIDALVSVALHGPRGAESRWHDVTWAAHDPRSTHWRDQEWRKLATAGMAELVKAPNERTADQVGDMLWSENAASIRYRYEDSDPDSMMPDDYWFGYEFPQLRQRPNLTAVEALKALDCYEYQSCEHPGWPVSEACRFVEALRGSLISRLPGYSAAAWDVSEPVTA